jgi:hypothetical protein
MSALQHLSSLLTSAAAAGRRELASDGEIDKLIAKMNAQAKGRKAAPLSTDLQLDALKRFWDSKEVKTFRDAYLLSWSLCLRRQPGGPCLMEDGSRLGALLEGVDAYKPKSTAYRRCYQGLVHSYFTYDPFQEAVPEAVHRNWQALRGYLSTNNRSIQGRSDPDWVVSALQNRQVFSEDPFSPYIETLLLGDASAIESLCEHLGINKASWFLRELVLAQVRGATRLSDARFTELLPRLIDLLGSNPVLRDRGMMAVLDRYAQIDGTPLHGALKDSAAGWWGNPWLPSNKTTWLGVTQAARDMVAEWLKLEFIETFFTKLAEDRLGDPRRMNFWKRYVKSITDIKFALGSLAQSSNEPDFVDIRKRMKGLICKLDAPGANNAFIMRMGPLIAVEFSGLGNALYGYDSRRSEPFDTSKMLHLEVDGRNSLKAKSQSILWLSHKDGTYGRWEDDFEQTLAQKFGLRPSSPPPRRAQAVRAGTTAVQGPAPAPVPISPIAYTRSNLDKFARTHSLHIDDFTSKNGNLWVRADGSEPAVTRTLTAWGFTHRPGKGWWK